MPTQYADLKQRCGRVVRCRSHEHLPEAERTVTFKFYVAELPETLQNDSWRDERPFRGSTTSVLSHKTAQTALKT